MQPRYIKMTCCKWFNRNMGCIEIIEMMDITNGLSRFNRNMGCIEIGK